MAKHHVVIIGSGFAGLKVAQKLKKADVKITLIAKTSHHLFQPLLYQVATGILSEGDIAPTTREILRRQKNAEVRLGLVEGIDVAERKVLWRNHNTSYETSYDTLVLAAGAGQSYFGNDNYAVFAPGMKTIDDALEIRARIFDAFEKAENEIDPVEREKLLTFAVVGAGPTGVEMAGQIRELASHTLKNEFRNINPDDARVILIDGAAHPLPAFGDKLGVKTRVELQKLGIEVVMNTLVTDLDKDSLTLESKDGQKRTIEAYCKVWAAGVQASELATVLAEQTGVQLDRSGRVIVNEDLTVADHPEIFVLGDMMSVPGVPGVAQGAIQSADFAAQVIAARLVAAEDPDVEIPKMFKYRDKGSMATISRFKAVVQMNKLEFTGFPAWLAWCFLHLLYIVGFKSQVGTLLSWLTSFMSGARSERTTTNQQLVGRLALEHLGAGSSGKLVSGEKIEHDLPAQDVGRN